MIFITFLPLISLFVSVIFLKDLLKASLIAYLFSLLVSFYYGVYLNDIISSHLDSIFSAIRVFLLVFSLLSLFKIQERKKHKLFQKFKKKNFITITLVGIFLTILIEGLVGFGTPGIIAVRTLYDLGFNPILSSIISLISDCYSTFGAFATPIVIGSKDAISFGFIRYAGIILSLLIFPILFLLYFLFSKLEKGEKVKNFKEVLIAGLIFFFSSLFLSQTVYFNLTIILASLGSILFLILRDLPIFRAFFGFFFPFFVSIAIFVFLRFLNIPQINLLFSQFNISPIVFLILLFYVLRNNKKRTEIYFDLFDVFRKSLKLLLIIFFLSFLSNYLDFSGRNRRNLPGILETISSLLVSLGNYYYLVSPIIGVFGAFIFGSATLSNLTFVRIQQEIAKALNLNVDKVLALQNIGAGIGNMISLYNISAIIFVIEELKGKEIEILKINSIVAILFSVISSVLLLFL